ncbi:MAG: HD-GYP domain-containing protein, partial [Actinomycetota bacterium]
LWARHPHSATVSFGELMLWSWLRRRRAERKLAEAARLLGLDRGEPVHVARLPADQQLEILEELNAALESKDPYTHGHSRRVARHVYRTALTMGLAVHAIEDLRRAAALHDVGKVRIPESIIRKPGPLTREERGLVEQHPALGAWMVSRAGSQDVVDAVRHHHERWDGRGYPDRLEGTDIPLFARIIAVADAFDAMTSTRPYRASLGRDSGVEILKRESGVQFDPLVVEAFLSTLSRHSLLPLAGVLVAFRWPRKAAREAVVAMKKISVSSLAPAAGAAGAAVLIGTSVLAPSQAPATPPPQAETTSSGSPSEVSSTTPTDGGSRAEAEGNDPAALGARSSRLAGAGAGATTTGLLRAHAGPAAGGPPTGPPPPGNTLPPARDPGGGGDRPTGPANDPPPGDPGPAPDPGPQDPPAPDPEPQRPPEPEPQPEPEPKPKEPPQREPRPRPSGDPQPEHGKDCDRNGSGKGNGSDQHCGG